MPTDDRSVGGCVSTDAGAMSKSVCTRRGRHREPVFRLSFVKVLRVGQARGQAGRYRAGKTRIRKTAAPVVHLP